MANREPEPDLSLTGKFLLRTTTHSGRLAQRTSVILVTSISQAVRAKGTK